MEMEGMANGMILGTLTSPTTLASLSPRLSECE